MAFTYGRIEFSLATTGRSIERNTPSYYPSRLVALENHPEKSLDLARFSQTSASTSTWYVTGVQTRQCVYITTVIGEWVAGAVKATAAVTGVAERRGSGGERVETSVALNLTAVAFCAQPLRRPPKTAHRRRHVGPRASTRRRSWGIFLRHIYSSN